MLPNAPQLNESQRRRLFFVLNKADYLDECERNAVLEFFHSVLREQASIEGKPLIFCVSARQGLQARLTGDQALWQESGLQTVQERLVDFLAREKINTLRAAIAHKTADLLNDVLMRLEMSIHSLQMPINELEKRLRIFEQKLKEAEQQRIAAQDLLAGDRNRLLQQLEDESKCLRQGGRKHLLNALETFLTQTADRELDDRGARDAVAGAIPAFFEHQLGETLRRFQTRLREVLQPHQERADALIESIRRTAAELFDVPYRAPDTACLVLQHRRPSWEIYKWNATLGTMPESFFDRFLPVRARRARLMRRLRQQIESLVLRNVETVRWPTFQDINDNIRLFGSELDARLRETIAATHGAMQAALAKRKEHADAVAGEIARLQTVARTLRAITKGLMSRCQTNRYFCPRYGGTGVLNTVANFSKTTEPNCRWEPVSCRGNISHIDGNSATSSCPERLATDGTRERSVGRSIYKLIN